MLNTAAILSYYLLLPHYQCHHHHKRCRHRRHGGLHMFEWLRLVCNPVNQSCYPSYLVRFLFDWQV
jgi:hypothetical protein